MIKSIDLSKKSGNGEKECFTRNIQIENKRRGLLRAVVCFFDLLCHDDVDDVANHDDLLDALAFEEWLDILTGERRFFHGFRVQ